MPGKTMTKDAAASFLRDTLQVIYEIHKKNAPDSLAKFERDLSTETSRLRQFLNNQLLKIFFLYVRQQYLIPRISLFDILVV